MNKNILKTYIKQGYSQHKIASIEKCSQTKVRRWLGKYGLKTKLKRRQIILCANCNKPCGKNAYKYCSLKCQADLRKKQFVADIKSGKDIINPDNGSKLRKYVLRTREHVCSICNKRTWNNTIIPLVVDHIDGNYQNIIESNLRLVCPNCDAQLPTYKNKNLGKGRHYRRERFSKKLSY